MKEAPRRMPVWCIGDAEVALDGADEEREDLAVDEGGQIGQHENGDDVPGVARRGKGVRPLCGVRPILAMPHYNARVTNPRLPGSQAERATRPTTADATPKKKKKIDARRAWAEARELLAEHRLSLTIGFGLMLISRGAGFVFAAVELQVS